MNRNTVSYEDRREVARNATLETVKKIDADLKKIDEQIAEIATALAGFQLANDEKVDASMLKSKLNTLKEQREALFKRREACKADLEDLSFFVRK